MQKAKIALFGSGRSALFLIDYLANSPIVELTVIDLSVENLKACAAQYPQLNTKVSNVKDSAERKKLIQAHGLVISLLPPALHEALAEEAIDLGKHFLSASYVSPKMEEIGQKAKAKGLVLLMECGLDPGIDHLSAMQVIDCLKAKGAKLTTFRSYTGGLVAPESDDNPWHYKLSWNPMNVVKAGQGVAGYLKNGQEKFLPYQRLFKETDFFKLDIGDFEGYYNRDAKKYKSIYGLEGVQTLIRGTLRRPGFCAAWDALVQLGLTDDSYQVDLAKGTTYADFTRQFLNSSGDDAAAVEAALGKELFQQSWAKIAFLGLFDHTPIGLEKASPAEVLNQILLEKWQMKPNDKDWVVMLHEFIYEYQGKFYELRSLMNLKGDHKNSTAMAKTVGWPLAIFTELLVKKEITAEGLVIPTQKSIYQPILEKLKTLGVAFVESEKSL